MRRLKGEAMVSRLSIDWPKGYYEALERVAGTPEYAGHLAVFCIAEPGQTFKAGNYRGVHGSSIVQDADYRTLDEQRQSAGSLGYEPRVHLQLEVPVPDGNVGCVMIYDDSVVLANVRTRAQQLRLDRSQPLEGAPAPPEVAVPAVAGELGSSAWQAS